MQIVDVECICAEFDVANPIRPQPIAILDPRREPFHALLCQPQGTIHASLNRIGNADPNASTTMYRGLLQEAVHRQAQLVVAPEYSIPWTVMDQIAHGPLRPPIGALWALGFESITPDELDRFRTSLAIADDVRLLHEPIDLQQRAQRAFIDPLVYVFWGIQAARAVLCVLVQFKTVPCRDEDHVELRSLYLGRNVYRFRNPLPSVQLVGIICSDAFEFDSALVDGNATDVLLLHIQLNQHPANPVYSAYRSRMYAVASNNNAEILCLNWAAGVRVEGSQEPFNQIAGSGWYVSPRAGRVNDTDINQLHHAGVYYSLVDTRWHGFYLNYSAHFLVLEKQRVFSTGAQVLAPRLAPHVVARACWNDTTQTWNESLADDGFDTFVQGYAPLNDTLPQMRLQDPLSVERAMELLEGTDGSPMDWHAIKELRALRVADEESLRRVTVSQETDRFRVGVAFRRERTKKARIAIGIPGQPMSWPRGAADLSNGFRYRWTSDAPHCNVEPLAGGGGPATLVFLGDEPDEDVVSNISAKLSKALRSDAIKTQVPGAEVRPATDRLCILYRRNNILQAHRLPDFASIVDPASNVEDDLTRGAQ